MNTNHKKPLNLLLIPELALLTVGLSLLVGGWGTEEVINYIDKLFAVVW